MKVLSMIAVALVIALPAAAQVTVIHGINGTDLGLPEEAVVDVSANDACIPNVPFRTVSDPLELPAGKYDVEIRLAGDAEGDDCAGTLVVSETFDIALTENATIIAHLNEEGVPALAKYSNDLSATSHDRARVTVRHAAAAPPVRVLIKRWRFPNALLPIDNPGSRTVELRNGSYELQIFDDQRGIFPRPLTGALPFDFGPNSFTVAYAIGSLDNGTFDFIFQAFEVE